MKLNPHFEKQFYEAAKVAISRLTEEQKRELLTEMMSEKKEQVLEFCKKKYSEKFKSEPMVSVHSKEYQAVQHLGSSMSSNGDYVKFSSTTRIDEDFSVLQNISSSQLMKIATQRNLLHITDQIMQHSVVAGMIMNIQEMDYNSNAKYLKTILTVARK